MCVRLNRIAHLLHRAILREHVVKVLVRQLVHLAEHLRHERLEARLDGRDLRLLLRSGPLLWRRLRRHDAVARVAAVEGDLEAEGEEGLEVDDRRRRDLLCGSGQLRRAGRDLAEDAHDVVAGEHGRLKVRNVRHDLAQPGEVELGGRVEGRALGRVLAVEDERRHQVRPVRLELVEHRLLRALAVRQPVPVEGGDDGLVRALGRRRAGRGGAGRLRLRGVCGSRRRVLLFGIFRLGSVLRRLRRRGLRRRVFRRGLRRRSSRSSLRRGRLLRRHSVSS